MTKEAFSLGRRLRALRDERHLTQRDLARLASLSPNAISLIERDEISPSVTTLQHLASALNVRMSYFFDTEAVTDVVHIKAGQRPAITSQGIRIEAAGTRLEGQQIDPFVVTLAPHSDIGRERVMHAGHECVYCIAGQVEYEIDGSSYRLDAGDLLLFEAELPHCWQNDTDAEAQILLILHSPHGPQEAVRRHFLSYPSLTHIR
jgi:transcriptional regulator with XRE-family HTH domain